MTQWTILGTIVALAAWFGPRIVVAQIRFARSMRGVVAPDSLESAARSWPVGTPMPTSEIVVRWVAGLGALASVVGGFVFGVFG